MKLIVVGFLIGLTIGTPLFLSIFNEASEESSVLGEVSVVTETPTSTPSPSPTATPSPTSTPTPTLSPTATPSATLTPSPSPTPPQAPEHLKHLFEQYGIHYNVDSQLLTKIAWCESRYNPEAVNGPYVGLFQFHKDRWITYRTQMGHDINPDLRANAEEAIKTAAYVISLGKLYMWPNCVPD